MRDMLRCRRGSVAFATVAAMVPLVGVVALGAEAGSWYVTKQHAQNAADAAAYSGALKLACSLGSIICTDTNSVEYRGKQFAAQNSFCNGGDTAYPGSRCAGLPSGISRTVTIATLTTWKGASGNFVQATVNQQQPAYLAKLLGLSNVTIAAAAVAEVKNPKDVCSLGLGRFPKGSALTIGGNVVNDGDGCGLMSNDTVKFNSDPNFTGSGWAVDAAKGCLPGDNKCNDPGVPHNYYMPPATNPLQALDTASFNSRTGNTSPLSTITCPAGVPADTKKCYSVTPNGTGAYKDLTVTTGDYVAFDPGTYFFYNAAIKINGGTVTGTGVTLVLLGDSSISITGGTVSLSAPATNTTYPDLSGVLIDDQAPNKSKNAVDVNGGGTVALGGAMYFPNVDVTWSGTTANITTTCAEVIANTLTMTGSAYMSTSGCASGTVAKTQVVALVP
jgi:hypothetical protein